MLPTGSTLEIFRSKYLAGTQTLHCFAHLKNDVAEALPYLTAANRQALADYLARSRFD